MTGTEPIGPGIDDVAADMASAVTAAAARQRGLAAQTFEAGSTIGALIDLPPVPESGGKHTAGTDAGYPA